MRTLIKLSVLLVVVFHCNASQAQFIFPEPSDSVFQEVDITPVFPGVCDKTEDKFDKAKCTNEIIYNHIRWQLGSNYYYNNGLEDVQVSFQINANGMAIEPVISQKVDPFLRDNVFAAVKSLPQMEPAKKWGIPVSFQYTVNILKERNSFKSQEISTKAERAYVFKSRCEDSGPRSSVVSKCTQENITAFIDSVLMYPETKQILNGRIVVQFVITKNGDVKLAKIIRGLNPIIDQEVVKVIEKLPQFAPARMKGKPVNIRATIQVKVDNSHLLNKLNDEFDSTASQSENDRIIPDHAAIFSEECQLLEGSDLQLECSEFRILRYLNTEVNFSKDQFKYRKEEGTVYISFDVNKDGEIERVEVLHSTNHKFNTEAIKAVEEMARRNKFIPAVKNGEKINWNFIIPINFRNLKQF